MEIPRLGNDIVETPFTDVVLLRLWQELSAQPALYAVFYAASIIHKPLPISAVGCYAP